MSWLLTLLLTVVSFLPTSSIKIKGLSFVATPRPFISSPFPEIHEINANYISVIPYGFTLSGQTKVHYDVNRQWWGERREGVIKTIEMAHENGLNVMLKPQIYIPGAWVGEMDHGTEQAWQEWEASYKSYILDMARIAADLDVSILCIGTEFKKSTEQRPNYWYRLIEDIREIYCGRITYSSNWDNYQNIPFWSKLDFIGISTYFPLSDAPTPSVRQLVRAWQPIKEELKDFSQSMDRPILFTEFGYLSVDQCAHKTWELESKVKQLNVNEEAQANAIRAIFEVFWSESFWAGGFLWKWFPNGQGHEGYIERDYTPQDKLAEEILKTWYSR